MRLLIAEDELISRRFLERALTQWGYEVVVTSDGKEAWDVLSRPDAPLVAVLDWMMPGMDGTEICTKLRQRPTPIPAYILLLTARSTKEDVVAGLKAGADDFLVKPFDLDELRARLQVGVRLVELQRSLADRVQELANALAEVKQLHGLLPLCAWCHKVRDDSNYWEQIESYVVKHSDTRFSHGICPDCFAQVHATVPTNRP